MIIIFKSIVIDIKLKMNLLIKSKKKKNDYRNKLNKNKIPEKLKLFF